MHTVKSNKLISIVASDQHTFSLTLLKLLFHNPPLFNELKMDPSAKAASQAERKKRKKSLGVAVHHDSLHLWEPES